MSDIISKICSMPKDFHYYGNKSMSQLFEETGYTKESSRVTKEAIGAYLTANPELIMSWESYSADKRYSPAWYFLRDGSDWIVGYSSVPSQEKKIRFTSNVEACTEFILRELREFAEHTPRI